MLGDRIADVISKHLQIGDGPMCLDTKELRDFVIKLWECELISEQSISELVDYSNKLRSAISRLKAVASHNRFKKLISKNIDVVISNIDVQVNELYAINKTIITYPGPNWWIILTHDFSAIKTSGLDEVGEADLIWKR